MVDSVGYLIKQHGEPIFDVMSKGIGPFLLQWLPDKTEVNAPLRAAAVCLCDDLVEFASPKAQALVPTFVPHMLDCMTASASLLRQPAVYGAGVLAEHGGASFDPFISDVVQRLGAVIQAKGARDPDNENVTDNAVSSVIKLVKFRAAKLPVDKEVLLRMALDYLPLKADGIEARLIHGWMVDGLIAREFSSSYNF